MYKLASDDGIITVHDLHTNALIGQLEYFKIKDGVYIRSFRILPSHRNRGAGTEMIKLLQQRYNYVSLHFTVGNYRAKQFYTRLGFSITTPTGRERFSSIIPMEWSKEDGEKHEVR